MSNQDIIAKKKTYFFPNAMHFYQDPPVLIKGQMQYLYDDTHKRYTDFFAGVTVVNCGHCNPTINAAVKQQMDSLQHTSIIYLTEPMVKLAERLAEILPGDINRTFFVNSGTEANEGALLLARMHTGKKKFIAFKGGLHGRSHLTMSVTGIPMWRIDPYIDEDVYFAECFNQPESSLASLEHILQAHGDEIAAIIFEPVQGNGGINVPPQDFFKSVQSLCKAHDVLLIADEVQTGFGRCGSMFAVEYFGIVPDIITFAKALGNGIPIGAFSATETVAKSFNKPSASTLGCNPVSMTAGLGVIDYIKKEKLVKRSRELGHYFKGQLETIESKAVEAVRGLGLMIGMELQTPEQVDYVLEEMKNAGYIIGKNGLERNTLAFQPPLVITQGDIDDMIQVLTSVLDKL